MFEISRSHKNNASTIARTASASFGALLDAVRIAFLISPLILSLPHSARAAEADIVTEYVDTVEVEAPVPTAQQGIGRFGPFTVIDSATAELNGITDQATPRQFAEMMRQHPALKLIRMVECAGTENDEANLAVARAIHRAGLSTHVPANGSVRSGGVELFLAGIRRSYDRGAEFGVHSWIDDQGNQARDIAADDPVNLAYINYYQDVGLAPATAKAFYAFTNQSDFNAIHYMTEPELARFGLVN